jgi:hypothetical protein
MTFAQKLWQGDEYINQVWTSEDLTEWQKHLTYVGHKLNALRWQIEKYERTGEGPLNDRFNKMPEEYVFNWIIGLPTLRSIKAMLSILPHSIKEFCETYTEEKLLHANGFFDKKVLKTIKEHLATYGYHLREAALENSGKEDATRPPRLGELEEA